MEMQSQITNLNAFELDEDLLMANIVLTPFASFAPESATDSSITFNSDVSSDISGLRTAESTPVGSKKSGASAVTGYVPDNIVDIYHNNAAGDKHIYVGTDTISDTIAGWPHLWPLQSITIGSDIYEMEYEFANTTNSTPNRWKTKDTITTSPFTTGNETVTFNWAWTPDRFLDVTILNTDITEL